MAILREYDAVNEPIVTVFEDYCSAEMASFKVPSTLNKKIGYTSRDMVDRGYGLNR